MQAPSSWQLNESDPDWLVIDPPVLCLVDVVSIVGGAVWVRGWPMFLLTCCDGVAGVEVMSVSGPVATCFLHCVAAAPEVVDTSWSTVRLTNPASRARTCTQNKSHSQQHCKNSTLCLQHPHIQHLKT